MRNLITASKELNKKETYLMMNNQATKKLRDAVGAQLEVTMWAKFEDVDDRDPDKRIEILSIKTADGDYLATNSATFIKEFDKIVEIFGGELPDIVVISGTSKNNREYISCTIADDDE